MAHTAPILSTNWFCWFRKQFGWFACQKDLFMTPGSCKNMTKCKEIISVLPFTCGIICRSYCTICCTNKAPLLTEGNVPMWCGWNAGTCLNASVTHKDLPLFLRIQFPMGSWQSILANISTESVVQNNYRSINVHLKSLTAFCCTDGYFICSFLFIWSWQMDRIEGIDLESVCIIFEWP